MRWIGYESSQTALLNRSASELVSVLSSRTATGVCIASRAASDTDPR